MQNLEQLRAAAALQAAPDIKREAISKLPGLIINNGLLAARKIISNADSIKSMTEELAGRDSSVLQRATAEALAFLAFLKRFAEKSEKKNG